LPSHAAQNDHPMPNVPCWPFQERNQPASSSQPRIQVWRPLFPRAAPGAPLHKLGTCRACSSRPRSRHESIAFAVTRSRRRPQRSAAGLRRRWRRRTGRSAISKSGPCRAAAGSTGTGIM